MMCIEYFNIMNKYDICVDNVIVNNHKETMLHSLNVGKLTRGYLKYQDEYVNSLSDEDIQKLGDFAVMHDIGKLIIANELLYKADTLTKFEFCGIKSHADIGYCVMKQLLKENTKLKYNDKMQLLDVIRKHHNNCHTESLYITKIVTVCDCFDAMMSDRCYRKSIGYEKAVNELISGCGEQFDYNTVAGFLRYINSSTLIHEMYNK